MEKEKGSVLLMTVVLISVFFILLGGLLPMMITEVRASANNTNYIIAKYAADAGAKLALQEAQGYLNQYSLDKPVFPKAKSFGDFKISNTSSATISASYTPLDANNNPVVDPQKVRPSRIRIQARGVYQGTSAQAEAYIFLDDTSPVSVEPGSQSSPTLLDMMNTATYSHGGDPKGTVDKERRWQIDPVNKCAHPRYFSQVMFNDKCGQDLNISYRASAKVVGKKSDMAKGGGYGILYGMIGNADNMNAYVLQYDPGAQYDESTNPKYNAQSGTLLVKKIVFPGDFNSNRCWENSGNPGFYEVNETKFSSYSGNNYHALPFEAAKEGEVLRIPLADSDATSANGGTSLQTIMNLYHNDKSFKIEADHTFTIVTKNDINGNKWHRIFCDDNPTPVLQFYDHTDPNTPVGKYNVSDFSNTHTGLRIWNSTVEVNFMNLTEGSKDSPGYKKSIVWVK